MKLDDVNRKIILLNAHHKLARKYRRVPLWSFISDICGVGATSAHEIARECGWNPHQDGSKHLTNMDAEALVTLEQRREAERNGEAV